MNVGESAESAVQHLGPLDVYEKYLLYSGHKAEGLGLRAMEFFLATLVSAANESCDVPGRISTFLAATNAQRNH